MQRPQSPLLCATVGVLLVGACVQEVEGDSVGASHAYIVDGEAHDGDPGVFYIIAGHKLCTGALISERVVLTAKHCVIDVAAEDIEVGTGPSVQRGRLYKQVEEVRTTPGAALENADIALLILQRAGPLTPYEWVYKNPPNNGAPITAIGFGQEETGPSGTGDSGEKRIADSNINQIYNKEFVIDGPTTCFGDSGGPAFLDDGRIFGVVSRGATNCEGITVYSRTDVHAALIVQAIADTGGEVPIFIATDAWQNNQDAQANTENPNNDASAEDSGANDTGAMATQTSTGCDIATRKTRNAWVWMMLLAVIVMRLRTAELRRLDFRDVHQRISPIHRRFRHPPNH